MKSKAHLVISLNLFKRDAQGTVETSQLNFVELAGTENKVIPTT